MLIAVYFVYRMLMRSPDDGLVRASAAPPRVGASRTDRVAWYVTWGVVVVAAAAVGRLRTALIVISTFWAFAGLTSVHNIYLRFLHTFVLTDLLLVAMLAAVAITPLGLLSEATARPSCRASTEGAQRRGHRRGRGPRHLNRRSDRYTAIGGATSARWRLLPVSFTCLEPTLDQWPEGGGVVRILLVGETHVARVVQHGDVVGLMDHSSPGSSILFSMRQIHHPRSSSQTHHECGNELIARLGHSAISGAIQS